MGRRSFAFLLFALVLLTTRILLSQSGQTPHATEEHPLLGSGPDSDQDGLSDTLEQTLLEQFSPAFMVADHDCSQIPSEFQPGAVIPVVTAENGTIYGQAFIARSSTATQREVELHYYHLWRQDCGEHGHALDTEHVSALVRLSGEIETIQTGKPSTGTQQLTRIRCAM